MPSVVLLVPWSSPSSPGPQRYPVGHIPDILKPCRFGPITEHGVDTKAMTNISPTVYDLVKAASKHRLSLPAPARRLRSRTWPQRVHTKTKQLATLGEQQHRLVLSVHRNPVAPESRRVSLALYRPLSVQHDEPFFTRFRTLK